MAVPLNPMPRSIQLHCNRITESLLTGRIFFDFCGLYKSGFAVH